MGGAEEGDGTRINKGKQALPQDDGTMGRPHRSSR